VLTPKIKSDTATKPPVERKNHAKSGLKALSLRLHPAVPVVKHFLVCGREVPEIRQPSFLFAEAVFASKLYVRQFGRLAKYFNSLILPWLPETARNSRSR
jgi:hypothetical protein